MKALCLAAAVSLLAISSVAPASAADAPKAACKQEGQEWVCRTPMVGDKPPVAADASEALRAAYKRGYRDASRGARNSGDFLADMSNSFGGSSPQGSGVANLRRDTAMDLVGKGRCDEARRYAKEEGDLVLVEDVDKRCAK